MTGRVKLLPVSFLWSVGGNDFDGNTFLFGGGGSFDFGGDVDRFGDGL